MPEPYVVLILTHGRPDRVDTIRTITEHGYTGPWMLVVDDEDPTIGEYRRLHGADRVVTFSKTAIEPTVDLGDNFNDRRGVVYARNAAFDVAAELGYRWFIVLDDDYINFRYRFTGDLQYTSTVPIRSLDVVFDAMMSFYQSCPPWVVTVAMGQGGDYIGGVGSPLAKAVLVKRKAMNSFLCCTDRRFAFPGRINEDVCAYTAVQQRGPAFMTIPQVFLDQRTTQSNPDGMTDLYLTEGTYVKSLYSVMMCPSGVKVEMLNSSHARVHHKVRYNQVAPKILRADV